MLLFVDVVEMMLVKGWIVRGEINNFVFINDGDWVGCVIGIMLKVLYVWKKRKKSNDYMR